MKPYVPPPPLEDGTHIVIATNLTGYKGKRGVIIGREPMYLFPNDWTYTVKLDNEACLMLPRWDLKTEARDAKV